MEENCDFRDLGYSFFKEGNFGEALTQFTVAFRQGKGPEIDDIMIDHMSQCCENIGSLSQALHWCDVAIGLSPGLIGLWKRRLTIVKRLNMSEQITVTSQKINEIESSEAISSDAPLLIYLTK